MIILSLSPEIIADDDTHIIDLYRIIFDQGIDGEICMLTPQEVGVWRLTSANVPWSCLRVEKRYAPPTKAFFVWRDGWILFMLFFIVTVHNKQFHFISVSQLCLSDLI